MRVEPLSREEKLRLLKALEEDAEFRYAVAGALGLLIVFEELRKLREDFNRFVEIEDRRWEEAYRRFEAIERGLEELVKVVGELKVAVGSMGRRLGMVVVSFSCFLDSPRDRYSSYYRVVVSFSVSYTRADPTLS